MNPRNRQAPLGPVETPTPVQPGITPTVPVTEEEEVVLPMLTSLELDGVTVDTDEVIREGLEPGSGSPGHVAGERSRRRLSLPGVGCGGQHRA